MRKRITILTLLAAVLTMSSCEICVFDHNHKEYDHVMLLYSLGFNSLSSYLQEDIQDLKTGYVPSQTSSDVLLIYGHHTVSYGTYSSATSPVLIRMYKDKHSAVVMDTLKVYPVGTIPTKKGEMRKVLGQIDSMYHAKSYGMIFSSHGTGWLPSGYYSSASGPSWASRRLQRGPLPEGAVLHVESDLPGPPTKSVGQTIVRDNGTSVDYELELADFANEFPFKLDYLIFDTCLMGGVEVAWQLRDVTGVMMAPPSEILAEGVMYPSVAEHLLKETPDVAGVAKDCYDYYQAMTGVNQSCIVSVVNCGAMDELASVCKDLAAKYRSQIDALGINDIQPFFRSYHHWFFDLEDIFVKAGIDSSEQARLKAALDKCIIYKAATENFMLSSSGFKVNTFCGLSMFKPHSGNASLDSFYRSLDWNIATGLVQ